MPNKLVYVGIQPGGKQGEAGRSKRQQNSGIGGSQSRKECGGGVSEAWLMYEAYEGAAEKKEKTGAASDKE